ncbi:MAG TPA: hypothetical protein VGV61_07795 [Thermoanaerobaculia bacterium]|nr:hypothetical protein [Thermoanaerobaculia bacterium]
MPTLAAALLLATPHPAFSSQLTPESGKAMRHDVSPRLDEMAAMSARAVKTGKPDRELNPLRAPHGRDVPDAAGGPDPLLQDQAQLPGAQAATPLPLRNFEGLSDDDNAAVVGGRIVPPDTNGDVGLSHYVQFINLIFAIYDKTTGAIIAGGGPFAGNTLWAGFGGPCETNNDGDPIVLYDHLADRWLFSQFSINEGIQCVALSKTGDPRGPYDRWAFLVSPGQQNDYPKLGLMPGAYYLSLRDFPSNDGDFASAVALDRAAMLAGNPAAGFVKFSLPCLANDCPDGIQPPHLEGAAPAASAPGIFSRAWDDDVDGPLTGADGYRLWQLSPNFATPAASTFTELPFVVSAGFDSKMCGAFQRACIIQPAPGEKVDPVDELQMYRAQYRHFADHDGLVINTTVDATGRNVAGVRWAELRNSGSGWTLFQEGTFAPADGLNRWMGSAAMDKNGNIAVGYSVAGRQAFASIRYTSRAAGDPLGTLPGGEVSLIEGSDVQSKSFNRWGDYSSLSVDPVDGCTFWYTQEYQRNDDARRDFDFKTRIGAFKLPGCT